MELCVALDLPTKEENLNLIRMIKDYDVWLKVGLRSYIRDGENFLKDIKKINPDFKIFLDLKLYDIPNTMADAAESIMGLNVDMFNVHASAGKTAMCEVMKRLQKYDTRPIVLAVTALTSFSEDEFSEVYEKSISEKADQFAKDAYDSGLDGVVCSAFESESIKSVTSKQFMTLTPGIRPFGEDAGDQKRVADVAFAKNSLVDFIVVGRPIYNAKNPEEVLKRILETL
ncbi:MAG: orotidine-5'-phosphate decarboxylase [Epsilonproteobacteria bacterium]|nr:orotidine-5'-phosphate decarboxylase [Campylobacterota bacterium]OIO14450.1 MAG: orotidine 5'-phosphate decarboxylase [Helicobacteraceae bacterium CG1_02_36_14]PIP10740.1 MAG: orotidine-5'-phosphate decarboxylase [Sulfurimonas sp. CG23_combo_of_CG06-09_8_20_14_all_36_33]PIS25074.1 MAG: orotidine-5'-phosphate decarboxylase [Sulfurimonas sp. CG08_land_8_20_14_0_20_36_33]PIU35204.1 MAG: orotidine-5'-phosphate decarboxylase [Sulfurimonas sp. CG07_land_8_20_14_0_80_36_56]PIV03227.1 MAG: orotidin